MGVHVYVDESERGAYLLCAALTDAAQVARVRAIMRAFRRSRQRRVHFAKESAGRRDAILAALVAAGLRFRVYLCRGPAVPARAACLRRLLSDLAEDKVEILVIEAGDAEDLRDRHIIFDYARPGGPMSGLVHRHVRAFDEPMLWTADAAAWAYGAGGAWRAAIRPAIEQVVWIELEKRETRRPTVRRDLGSTSSG